MRSEAKENQIELFWSHQYLEKVSQLNKRMMLEQMGGISVDGRKSAMEPKQIKSSCLVNKANATVQSSW